MEKNTEKAPKKDKKKNNKGILSVPTPEETAKVEEISKEMGKHPMRPSHLDKVLDPVAANFALVGDDARAFIAVACDNGIQFAKVWQGGDPAVMADGIAACMIEDDITRHIILAALMNYFARGGSMTIGGQENCEDIPVRLDFEDDAEEEDDNEKD